MAKEKNEAIIVKEALTKIFEMCGVASNFEVKEDKVNENLEVNIDSGEEAGLLIGKRGDTVFSIQQILALIVKQQTNEWKRIIVNVGDWREKQEEYLKSLALQAVERVKETGEAEKLYNLNASQRRVVHMVLSEEKDIVTESEGEGVERCLVVKPNK
jgi:spoIIIJ-associated protein